MRDIDGDTCSIISTIDEDSHSSTRIHRWLSHQCSLDLTLVDDEHSESAIASSMSQQFDIRADSPLLGFPSLNEMSDEDETHDVRVHQTSRLSRYSFVAEVIADQETVSSGDISDEAEPLAVLAPSSSRTPTPSAGNADFVPPPLPFTRLPFLPRRKSTPTSHSRNDSSSSGRLSISRSHAAVTSTLPAGRVLPKLHSASNSIARQPSLPLLREASAYTTSQPSGPPVLPKLFPVTLPIGRARSQSVASPGAAAHSFRNVQTPPPTPRPGIGRRQSTNNLLTSASSSSLCLSRPNTANGTGSPDHSVRNAVYIDSEEITEKLSEFLRMRTDPDDLDFDDALDSAALNERELLTPTPERLAPPNTPLPHSFAYRSGFPPSRTSQIYLGPVQNFSRPSTIESTIPFDNRSQVPSLSPSSSSQGEPASPMFSQFPQESEVESSPSKSAKGSSPGRFDTLRISKQGQSGSENVLVANLVQDREKEQQKEKPGKRKRLVSFISRFSTVPPVPSTPSPSLAQGPWSTSPVAPPVPRRAEDAKLATAPPPSRTPVAGNKATAPLKINTSFTSLPSPRATHTPTISTSTFASVDSGYSAATSSTSVSSYVSSPPKRSAINPTEPILSPGPLSSFYPLSSYTLGLDDDPFASNGVVSLPNRMSIIGAPTMIRSSPPTSPIDAKPSPFIEADLVQPNAIATPATPSKKKNNRLSVQRSSLGLGLRGLIGRVLDRDRDGVDIDSLPPPPSASSEWERRQINLSQQDLTEESEWDELAQETDLAKSISNGQDTKAIMKMGVSKMAGVKFGMGRYRGMGLQTSGRKRLVVKGINENNAKGFEAVKIWCEAFGEIRDIQRKDGALYVDFRKPNIADAVCRVPQVYINGAGSVSLSWCSPSMK